ncbi:hypothetical protein M9H77_13608 [Catharanthus roseus]|uniref:Uncharacterized protein n=1 Tax=Catharanthus roseus TaxID=4058 RepID=A0ACC0BKW4_CATRO|nr:hypothetical protein M9H77_13608 [Catharanthus roseus]
MLSIILRAIADDSILLECVEEEIICLCRKPLGLSFDCKCVSVDIKAVVETSIEDSLVGTVISFEEDAFKLYNDHAFRLRFSIHKGNKKFKAGCKLQRKNSM